jgi:putative hydrolase of the HAD superfamily
MSVLQHVFFDLDSTLWDFEKNALEALQEITVLHNIGRNETEQKLFIHTFMQQNDKLWELYRKDLITKEDLRFRRFSVALKSIDMNRDDLIPRLSTEYLDRTPNKQHLIPNCKEILDYLKTKYTLHIITDGFREIQHIKMKRSGIFNYFKEIITSDCVGCKKPDPRMFSHALSLTGAKPEYCIMIGDNLHADILGAKNAGWQHAFFNPKRETHQEELMYEIFSLEELRQIL